MSVCRCLHEKKDVPILGLCMADSFVYLIEVKFVWKCIFCWYCSLIRVFPLRSEENVASFFYEDGTIGFILETGSSVSSTEKDIDTRLTKAWTAIDKLSIIWKSDLTDKMKRSFFQAAVVSILLYGCTTWTLTKRLEKKLDGNYARMQRQHHRRHRLYGHLPPITKTIQVRRTRHAGHCWRSRDELISDVLLWTPTYGRAKAGRPARTYIQQLCEDTGCSPEDLPEAMNDREKWRERVMDICVSGTTWWWWWYIYIYIYIYKTSYVKIFDCKSESGF